MEPEKPKKTKSAKRARGTTPGPQPAKATPPRSPASRVRASSPSSSGSSAPRPRKKVSVPPILLEGDQARIPVPSGPGERYATRAELPADLAESAGELPEAYGTKRLLLVARDPHWLYAHWDLTDAQLREYNAASRDRHLIVRLFKREVVGRPILEQHVHPESRNWFLHVPSAGTRYVAQLGYYDADDRWVLINTSAQTVTPPDSLSSDTTVRFETIPVEVSFQKLLETVKAAVAEHVPLVEALQELRQTGHSALPAKSKAPAPWTPQQERALAQVINIDEVRRVWMGSLEITELIRRQLQEEISSQAAAAFAGGPLPLEAARAGISSVSSPFGGEQRRKGFWFNVNAELIIYGATEPDAQVTIGGRRIQLRSDGTFSFRFALPDGDYPLPVEATSADGDDSRAAHLKFGRETRYCGEVGTHPQSAALRTPRAENVA